MALEPPCRIDNSADRLRAGDLPDRQLRIVSDRRSDADNHNIYQRPQPVKMINASWTIDVLRMARSRRNPTIKRLAELTDDHEIVHGPMTKRAKDIYPILRERLLPVAKRIDEIFPAIIGREFGRWAAKLHGSDQTEFDAVSLQY
jgi:hypothetical protein